MALAFMYHVYSILQIKKWLSDMRANKPAYIVIQHFIRSFRREASFLFHAKRKDRVSRSFLLHRKIYTSVDTYFSSGHRHIREEQLFQSRLQPQSDILAASPCI